MKPRILVLVAVTVLLATTAEAGLRTKMIRLVPVEAWVAEPGPIVVTTEVTTDAEKAEELEAGMVEWAGKAFEKLDFDVREDADLVFRVTIDEFDFGSQAKRLTLGGGKAYVAGTVVVVKSGEEVARYRYSAQPRGGFTGGSMGQMGKEVAPPLVLKWTNGETDESLHER